MLKGRTLLRHLAPLTVIESLFLPTPDASAAMPVHPLQQSLIIRLEADAAPVFGADLSRRATIYYAVTAADIATTTTQALSRAGSAMGAARTWRAIFTGFAASPVTRLRFVPAG